MLTFVLYSYYVQKNQVAVNEIIKEAMGRNGQAKEDDLQGTLTKYNT